MVQKLAKGWIVEGPNFEPRQGETFFFFPLIILWGLLSRG
jgi:hypothetical protein